MARGEHGLSQSAETAGDPFTITVRQADGGLDFLGRAELRPIRLQLELLEPELVQQEVGVRSTIVVVGSARLLEAVEARSRENEQR